MSMNPSNQPLLQGHTYIPNAPDYSPLHIPASPNNTRRMPPIPQPPPIALTHNDWIYTTHSIDPVDSLQNWYATIDGDKDYPPPISRSTHNMSYRREIPTPIHSNGYARSCGTPPSPKIPPSPGRAQFKPPPSPLMSQSPTLSGTPPSSPPFSPAHMSGKIPITYI